jgi:exopolyphosphatase/pppGpp-phosphohydrolase
MIRFSHVSHEKVTSTQTPTELVAVLDMGASAIRLVVAEVGPGGVLRVIEDVSRGVLLGRDTFSTGRIRA